MEQLDVKKCGLCSGLYLLKPSVFADDRGVFFESYHKKTFAQYAFATDFVQDNITLSKQGALRGLHYQLAHPQKKLIQVLKGEIYDVVVDCRKDSPTFGNWYGVTLSDKNRLQFYMDPGFAHGYVCVSDEAIVMYKVSDFYDPENQVTIRYDDTDLHIDWHVEEDATLLLSERDKKGMAFSEFIQLL